LEEQVFVKSKKTLISSVEGINKNWKKHALSGNAVKDFIRCFPAKGPSVRIAWAISPGQSVSRVSKPQSGRPFDEHRIELSARWACVNDQSTVTRADGAGYWNEWPVGPEPQMFKSMALHRISFYTSRGPE